ncbi:MAG: S8 family serine peptidase [Phycisphaerae bacterium]
MQRGRRTNGSKRGTSVLFATLTVVLAVWLADAAPARSVGAGPEAVIRWRSGTLHTVPKTVAHLEGLLSAAARRPGERHLVLQFKAPVDAKTRGELLSAGVRLLNYLGDNAFFASVAPRLLDPRAVARVGALVDVMRIDPGWRLHPYLLAGKVPRWAVVSSAESADKREPPVVGAYVLFHPDVPLAPAGAEIVTRHGGVVRDFLESVNGLVVELPFEDIASLADEDAVQWIEPPLPRMVELNDSNRIVTEVDVLQAPPYGLDGTGVTVLVYDGGYALASHPDFGGRLTVHDASELSDHSTHVAGTVGGNGSSSAGQYRGMAPAVAIESYGYEYDGTGIFLYTNPGDISADYNEAINVYGADISNNSIGTNTCWNFFPCEITGDYGVTSALIDAIVGGSLGLPFRVVWANGNERSCTYCPDEHQSGYHSTAPPGCAKNHLTVGALNSNNDSQTDFTSWGPCDDGRLKPDLSAPGCQSNGDGGVTSCSSYGGYTVKCGTSMAAPTVAGIGALLLQDYRRLFPGADDFTNATLRAMLAHTAQDRGNLGPDYSYGYGSVRARAAVDFLRAGNFLEDQVGQGESYSVLVIVGPGDAELKVTLAWDDVPGTPNVDPALVNDLDLVVYDPSSVRHFPWTLDPANPASAAVRTQADHVNNIEQVFVNSPAAGAWRVEVHGFTVPVAPQAFSLTASPLLVDCSTQGVISTDRSKYGCQSNATIQVVDCDLNTDDGTIETVTVSLASDTEPTGETLVLTETAAESAAFRGTIALSTTDAAGVLHVAEGDTVTAVYVDADDGFGGTNVTVETTALVDCQPPVISGIRASDIGPFDATLEFDTDEASLGSWHYGTACAALSYEVAGAGYKTAHSVHITGLQENSTYFYTVAAEDEAGNTLSDDAGGVCYTFDTPDIPNYFTEEFNGDNDVDYQAILFTPDGSGDFYYACAETIDELPTNPAGGTPVSLSDDDWIEVNVGGGQSVALYGTAYTSYYVGSNGYVTFNGGDDDYSESLAEHFSPFPRISALYDDFNPAAAGQVSWKELTDRAVVTWLNVPEYSTSNTNTFQIEMFFDGRLRISYSAVDASDGIVGLSRGDGLPAGFFEVDLSASGTCGDRAPVMPLPPHDARKNRYVSINPNNVSTAVALRIECTSMKRCSGNLGRSCRADADCALPLPDEGECIEHPSVGYAGWVSEPFDPTCQTGPGTPPVGPCRGADYLSRVIDTPVFRQWAENPLHIGDCEIVPVATYAVQATADGVLYSLPLEVGTIRKPGTWYYGDTVGQSTGDAFTPPQGVVNVTDIQAYIFVVQHLRGAPHISWVDLHGLGSGMPPNFLVNVSDLQNILFGFQGQLYTDVPEHLDPADCP